MASLKGYTNVPSDNNFPGDCDVVIIGGGPAGSSTALHLQQINPDLATRTMVLEKAHHPREKTCGGALTLNAQRIIADLGIRLDIPYTPVDHVRLIYGEDRIDLPPAGCADRVIRRADLDNALFQAVKARGVQTMEGVRVARVIRRPNHLEVITDKGRLRAQVAVSADGVNAILRRTPGFGRGKISRIHMVETPADPAKEVCFLERVLLIDMSYLSDGIKGYYWEFPSHLHGQPFVNRGLVAGSCVGGKKYLCDILLRRGVDPGLIKPKAWPIGHFDPRGRFSQPRMLLVGDAMGSDPLFSEGISQALAGGRLAAESLDKAFKTQDLSFREYTRYVLRSRMGTELTAYARAARLFYGRHSRALLSLLHESPELRNLVGLSYAGTERISQNIGQIAKIVVRHLLGRGASSGDPSTGKKAGAPQSPELQEVST
jgi:flavin-dependent dehydrogenase